MHVNGDISGAGDVMELGPVPGTAAPPPAAPQLVLLPRVPELPGFHGAAAEAVQRLEELERYRCLEAFHMAPPHALAEACARLICSVSAMLHDGALRESGAAGMRGCEWVGRSSPAAPQPASATRRAPAAACARCCPGSVSASPTSSAAAVTAAHPAAMASDPWGAAVSSRVCWCVRHAGVGSLCLSACLPIPLGWLFSGLRSP